jgi:DNA-directed RNA polymerase alpha subunit
MEITVKLDMEEFEEFLEFKKNRNDFYRFQINKEEKKKEEEININTCGLGSRVNEALARANIYTLEQFSKIQPVELLKIRDFGRGGLSEVQRYCQQHNIRYIK